METEVKIIKMKEDIVIFVWKRSAKKIKIKGVKVSGQDWEGVVGWHLE